MENNVIRKPMTVHIGMLYTDGATYGTLLNVENSDENDNPYVVLSTIGGKIAVSLTIFLERWERVSEVKKQS
jgi:hypothetical protein